MRELLELGGNKGIEWGEIEGIVGVRGNEGIVGVRGE